MNALYAGRIVWNRQRFVKDPDTGRRVSRPNPESEWLSADVPELRIVDQETFETAQNRKAARAGDKQRHTPTRPRLPSFRAAQVRRLRERLRRDRPEQTRRHHRMFSLARDRALHQSAHIEP
jgi:hypothetical protein